MSQFQSPSRSELSESSELFETEVQSISFSPLMWLPKPLKIFLSFFMCLLMSNLPSVAAANQAMLPTSIVVADMDRAQAQAKVEGYLNRADVQKALVERGLSPDEAKLRLASLSETELKQMAGQVDQARAGGDILIAILIIVLIIFLIKRI